MTPRQFEVSDAIVSAELGAEAVLLDVGTGRYYGLDDTASLIWRLVGEGLHEDEISERLFATYDVAPDQARQDVSSFLQQLVTNGLIRARSGP